MTKWRPIYHESIPDPAAELRALRDLREACGMYCEQLPIEVREALHVVPEINKMHHCELSKEQQPAPDPGDWAAANAIARPG
jgi:hypothetical protein